jgi:hypothetical protein
LQGVNAYADSVADVVSVGCHEEAGQPVTLEDAELSARCGNALHWAQPEPYSPSSGPGFGVTLDSYGNALAVLWASGCRAGETHISATLGVPPDTNVQTSFTVLPPQPASPGASTIPAREIEGATGEIATVIEATFSQGALKRVELSASNLFHRCATKPHLHWIYHGRERAGGKTALVNADANGNAFTIVLGAGCSVGESLVLAELTQRPYTQYVTSFIGLPPQEML